jgi:hypothetical protein
MEFLGRGRIVFWGAFGGRPYRWLERGSRSFLGSFWREAVSFLGSFWGRDAIVGRGWSGTIVR